jgi:3',5'-cyclic AMP phosphodiesterase CpdA
MIRLAHLSDIHISSPSLEWRWRDWFNKRMTSWGNLRFSGRERRFARADDVLSRLMDQLPGRGIDHVIFSGDATALGFESEFRRAAEILRVDGGAIPGIAVPGNHDYLTRTAARSGHFEKYFAPWQHGTRLADHRYPFAQRVGPVWLVGVNAARGNRVPWNAAGHVGPEQTARLERLLESLAPGPRLLVIHYPICLASGVNEQRHHGLSDLSHVIAVAAKGGVCLWLHGHRHEPYFFEQLPSVPFAAICAGTATEHGIWSYNEYTIDGNDFRAVRRAFDPESGTFKDAQEFVLFLPGPVGAPPIAE